MTDELNKVGDEMVEVTDRWVPPSQYETIIEPESGKPLTEIFPSGMFWRSLGDQILEVDNLTRQEAEQRMLRPSGTNLFNARKDGWMR